jgi:hypothetical protein
MARSDISARLSFGGIMSEAVSGPVASVTIKDTDAEGSVELSVEAIPGGHHLNIVAKWVYDRAQTITKEAGLENFSNPNGAMGECKILVSEVGERIKVSVDFGEEGTSDDFFPLSHQLGMFLIDEVLRKLGAKEHIHDG